MIPRLACRNIYVMLFTTTEISRHLIKGKIIQNISIRLNKLSISKTKACTAAKISQAKHLMTV